MFPFTKNSDYIQLISQHTCEGEGVNYINIREEWHNLNDIILDDRFVSINSGEEVFGSWKIDGGDEPLSEDLKERRAFCRKGKVTFTFSGTGIILRIYVNPDYGVADVRIDGVKPSLISGVTQARDIVTCNAYDIEGTWGEEYIDVTLANKLSDTSHTVELYAENGGTGVGGWFCIAGYKISEFANRTRNFDCWITSEKIEGNKEILRFCNTCGDNHFWGGSIYNVRVTFDSYFVDSMGVSLPLVEVPEIPNEDEVTISFFPDVQGFEMESQEQKYLRIYAEYEDLNGSIVRSLGVLETLAENEDDYEVWPEGTWNMYEKTFCPGGPNEITAFITSHQNNGAYLEFDFFGPSITVECIQGMGFHDRGSFNVLVDDISVGSIITVPEVECKYVIETFSGFTNTSHTLKLLIDSLWGWVYFYRIWYEGITRYTPILELIKYNYNLKHIPPFPSENARFNRHNATDPTCDTVNLTATDYNIPRLNAGVDMLYFDRRVATFAVCYQPGFEDILKTYDIVIVEPKSLTRTIVKAYQDLGIKVICYCSYGEEIGTYENEWDAASSLVPHTGDGLGVGGYASYYNKGGNQFGECSECKHDRQRLEEVTECALNQPQYAAAIPWGRCSNACENDSREGYNQFIVGGTCWMGHSRSNNWSRTASKACTNSSCPDYLPVNSACPFYESPDAEMFGQDFSMFTPNWPDENGIWNSFFVNPRQPAWSQRLRDFYLPTIFAVGVQYIEIVTVEAHAISPPGSTVEGFKVGHVPIDTDELIQVKNIGENYIYTNKTDYLIDLELGTFKMQVQGAAPPAPPGTQLEVIYTRKGLCADGIFLDTIDTVDVYSGMEYQQAMVDIIGQHHAVYINKTWAMNRGFTILESLMPYTDYVMFETFITSYNWDTGVYYEITDPDHIAANQVFIDQLFDLRVNNKFNVLGLNYCDKDDDVLKQLIAEKTRQYAWLSWSSEIALNNPQENEEILTPGLLIETNAWRLVDELPLP